MRVAVGRSPLGESLSKPWWVSLPNPWLNNFTLRQAQGTVYLLGKSPLGESLPNPWWVSLPNPWLCNFTLRRAQGAAYFRWLSLDKLGNRLSNPL
jgi:hypothetical protein